ncbi:hypothetical protein A9Q75_13450 [Colwellia psychrerythraea]|uniref:Uncharacterized protein n=1 Tax=Colwellia psychrerythraea TaxID=28229 RepID=A0A1Y5E7P3_COLPS|nr:hypothetical protein A9Q75_13450 [Colwellia psychrerythraea]
MTESKLDTAITTKTVAQSYRANLLEGHSNVSVVAKSINLFLIVLIISNVIAAIFESESNYHEQYLVEFS